jgi:hypothetical protein
MIHVPHQNLIEVVRDVYHVRTVERAEESTPISLWVEKGGKDDEGHKGRLSVGANLDAPDAV